MENPKIKKVRTCVFSKNMLDKTHVLGNAKILILYEFQTFSRKISFFAIFELTPFFILFFVLYGILMLSKVLKKLEFGHLVVGQLLRARDSIQERYSHHFLCFLMSHQENRIFICKPEMPNFFFVRGPFKLSKACRFFVQLNRFPWDKLRKKNDLH